MYVIGRKNQSYISGGVNIFPLEIEQVLVKRELVKEAAVIGVDDEQWGEVGVAFVEKNRITSEAEILKELKRYLASYKIPREIIFLDSFPKSGIGKIDRNKLKNDYNHLKNEKGILFSLLLLTIASSTAQEKINDLVKYSLPVKSINLNSETIAYAEDGSGEKTLLFIHGLSSTLEAWKKNIQGLKDDYRCIAVDLPGYGKSSRNSTNYSLNDYGGMLQEFIEKKDLKNVILVGHSMGGQIAMHTVLNYPGDFKKLVLIAPAGIETFSEQEATLMKASIPL